MKKIFLTCCLTLFSLHLSFADSFINAIQDLAVRTACIGQYSMTQAGGVWYEDPHDYYTPQMIATRLAEESGEETESPTFYGICFNYAKAAYKYIEKYNNWYRNQGMRENQFWIAGVHENSNQIELQYPGTSSNYTTIQNGVYVKIPAAGAYNFVRTHKDLSGKRAIHHAWIWILRSDGVQFWVDPTWTDNLGYVVYGYVSDEGEEMQCRPNKDYCISYPNYLNNLPSPPQMGQRLPPSKTANSSNPEETIQDARFYIDLISGEKVYVSPEAKDGLVWSIGIHTASSFLETFNIEPSKNLNVGVSLSCESIPIDVDVCRSMIFMWQIDYFAFEVEEDISDDEKRSDFVVSTKPAHALLFDINLGYQLGYNYYEFGIYGGGGIGYSMKESYFPLIGEDASFAWEWKVGSRLMLDDFSLRGEVTYMNKTGYMVGFYLGLIL